MVFLEAALEKFAGLLGVNFPDLVLIIVLLASLIVYGIYLRIGLLFSIATVALTFIVFTLAGMANQNVLTVFLILVVLLSLSLLIRKNNPGAI